MSATDIDLTDAMGDKTVPFTAAKSSALTSLPPVCDGCENFMRYILGSRSRTELRRRLNGDLDEREATLQLLSWTMSLKQSGECERVSRKKVDAMMSLVRAQEAIYKRIKELRNDPEASADDAGVNSGLQRVPLPEYIGLLGNPLVNKHKVVSMKVNDTITLGVLLPAQAGEGGRFALRAAVQGSWNTSSPMPPSVQALERSSVDDLKLLTLAQGVRFSKASRTLRLEIGLALLRPPALRARRLDQPAAASPPLRARRTARCRRPRRRA